MRTKLVKLHTVKSHLIAQLDKSNDHTSVAISCASSPVRSRLVNCLFRSVENNKFLLLICLLKISLSLVSLGGIKFRPCIGCIWKLDFTKFVNLMYELHEHKWVLFPAKLSPLCKGPLEVDLNFI